MNNNLVLNALSRTVLVAGVVMSSAAWATENGGSMYNHGGENFNIGAMPPAGMYYMLYGGAYHADKLVDNKGDALPIDFDVKANSLAARVVRVTDLHFAGGQFGFYGIVPLVDLSTKVAGQSQDKTGLGDIVLGAGLGYHLSDKLHYAVSWDLGVPVGDYDKNDLANLGRNYWTWQNVFAITYLQPAGINADLKVMYDINSPNHDTQFHSGNELHSDFALGWAFGNGWTAGVGGYLYQQVTDDKVAGVTVADNRGRAFAVGPSVKYDAGKWFITGKYEKEFNVRNRAEGGAFKVKAILPF